VSKYIVTKKYGHDRGYSVAFRQWKAVDTHCKLLHGYPLAFTFELEGDELDHRNWLFSFGEFKIIKTWLDQNFDHTTLVATDDPALDVFRALESVGACKVITLEKVGCEALAKYIYDNWAVYIETFSEGRATLKSITVAEHEGNSVTYKGV